MKKLLFLLCATLVLGACSDKKSKSDKSDKDDDKEITARTSDNDERDADDSDYDSSEDFSDLEAIIAQENALCPIDLGVGTVATGIEKAGNYVICTIECDESMVVINNIAANSEQVKEIAKSSIASDPLSDALKAHHMGLKYKYVGSTSGETVYITFSPNEILSL